RDFFQVTEKLLDPASAKQTDTILKALTETLGSSVKYLPPGTEQNYNEALAETKKRSGNGGGFKITEVGKNTAYCRIRNFNENNTEQLQQFLDQLGGEPYQAAVFDLRFSDGSSYDQAVATGKILKNTQSPAAIIINGETSGAAEVFVSIAKQQSKTVLIGQPSRGMPFRLEKHVLGNGGRLLVPDRNIAGADLSWPPAPLVPVIEIKQKLTQPQLDELNRRDFGMPRLSRDPALRRAVDLITVIKGLANKHFQPE
ncbi:MAG: S41 family peptidase, partial [Lentisphaeria bacterium]